MSNIDKQALREAAERAESDSWGYDRDEFNEALTPSTVLALLDELEAKDKSISFLKDQLAQLANFNPDWDKLEAATDSLREHMEELTAARKRIAELEARLETADKLQDSAFRHGLQHGFSLGQTDNQAGFEECLSAYRARGKDNG
ncbi:ead/Ea22-like family protein [Enterobacter ludwigii]|uniref:ead/Ea22-like family protein n=1 Tax=Enterobacter ludwigii TaxID=299767 RepID=UPI001BA98EB2|nr:ead/Ea22-like family protein [Enterobacter ludwigii]MBS0870708.1 ead/Ea22-like family protein [Enterobacter ludwigii]